MKQQAKIVVDSIQPLFETSLELAERIGNDQIFVSTLRAKEILKQLKDLSKELKKQQQEKIENKYLDAKFTSFI
jgi:hypothetical protein